MSASAADAEMMAVYGALEEAREQQILDYRRELAEEAIAQQRVEGSR
jgi:hypothetical protein